VSHIQTDHHISQSVPQVSHAPPVVDQNNANLWHLSYYNKDTQEYRHCKKKLDRRLFDYTKGKVLSTQWMMIVNNKFPKLYSVDNSWQPLWCDDGRALLAIVGSSASGGSLGESLGLNNAGKIQSQRLQLSLLGTPTEIEAWKLLQ